MSNLWTETINERGESSLKTHEIRKVFEGCKEGKHHFVFSGGSLREATCMHCPTTVPFILGLHQIKDGKLVTV